MLSWLKCSIQHNIQPIWKTAETTSFLGNHFLLSLLLSFNFSMRSRPYYNRWGSIFNGHNFICSCSMKRLTPAKKKTLSDRWRWRSLLWWNVDLFSDIKIQWLARKFHFSYLMNKYRREYERLFTWIKSIVFAVIEQMGKMTSSFFF